MIAVIDDDFEQVKLIIDENRENLANYINERKGWNESSALMLAALCNRVNMIELLLKNNADPNLQNNLGIIY